MTITGEPRICEHCGKEFTTYRHARYSYKRTKRKRKADGKYESRVAYYCCYSCYSAGE